MRRWIHLVSVLFVMGCGGTSGITDRGGGESWVKFETSVRMLQTGVDPMVTPSLVVTATDSSSPAVSDLRFRLETAQGVVVPTTTQSGGADPANLVVGRFTLVPKVPLDVGWYHLRFRKSGTIFQYGFGPRPEEVKDEYVSAFHVGPLPLIIGVQECRGHVNATISEGDVMLPATIPMAVVDNGQPLACKPIEMGISDAFTSAALECQGVSDGPSAPTSLTVQVSSGMASTSGVPVQNLHGDTSFGISLTPMADTACLQWIEPQMP